MLFDKLFWKAQDNPKVGGWIFLDPSDAVSNPSVDDKLKLMNMIEEQYKVLDLYARTSIIQRGTPVDHVTVDRISTTSANVSELECSRYVASTEVLSAKNLDAEAWLIDGLLKHHRKKNRTLEFLVQ